MSVNPVIVGAAWAGVNEPVEVAVFLVTRFFTQIVPAIAPVGIVTSSTVEVAEVTVAWAPLLPEPPVFVNVTLF
jgi:uncharacterized membrane protein